MKIIPALVAALALAACGGRPQSTPEPLVIIQEVIVPIVGACVPRGLGDEPAYSDTDAALIAAPEGAVRFQLLVIGRVERQARLKELEPVVKACPKEK